MKYSEISFTCASVMSAPAAFIMATVSRHSSGSLLAFTTLRRSWHATHFSWITGLADPSLSGKPPGWLGSACTTWAWAGSAAQRDANAINAGNERFFIVSPSRLGVRRYPRVAPSLGNNAVIVGTDFLLGHRTRWRASGGPDELLNGRDQRIRRHAGDVVLGLDRHLLDVRVLLGHPLDRRGRIAVRLQPAHQHDRHLDHGKLRPHLAHRPARQLGAFSDRLAIAIVGIALEHVAVVELDQRIRGALAVETETRRI